ncbi:hypothetical protein H0H93_006405, partial [Arthromyces matolae]
GLTHQKSNLPTVLGNRQHRYRIVIAPFRTHQSTVLVVPINTTFWDSYHLKTRLPTKAYPKLNLKGTHRSSLTCGFCLLVCLY